MKHEIESNDAVEAARIVQGVAASTCSLPVERCGFKKTGDPDILCNREATHGGEHCRLKQDDHGPKYFNIWWPQKCPECGEVAVKDHNSISCDVCKKLWPLEYVRLVEQERISENSQDRES